MFGVQRSAFVYLSYFLLSLFLSPTPTRSRNRWVRRPQGAGGVGPSRPIQIFLSVGSCGRISVGRSSSGRLVGATGETKRRQRNDRGDKQITFHPVRYAPAAGRRNYAPGGRRATVL
jgi:hypothetical protein